MARKRPLPCQPKKHKKVPPFLCFSFNGLKIIQKEESVTSA